MSCNHRNSQVSRWSRLKGGISHLSSQAAGVAGTVATTADTATNLIGRGVSRVTNPTLKAVDRPTTVGARVLPVAAATAYGLSRVFTVQGGVQAGNSWTLNPKSGETALEIGRASLSVGLHDPEEAARRLLPAARLVDRYRRAGGVWLALAGARELGVRLARQPGGERRLSRSRRVLLSRQKLSVQFSRSRLTALLNSQDSLVSRQSVVSSQGDIIRLTVAEGGEKSNGTLVGNTLWHRGTTVVKSSAGERTITHLRGLSPLGTSHYFDRPLSDRETAGLVAGELKAHRLPGYIGTIAGSEKLAPSWAAAKRAMILTRLHWPPASRPSASAWQPEGAGVTLKPPPRSGFEQREPEKAGGG